MTALLLTLALSAGEPEFQGRPMSQWLAILKEDDTPRRRRAAAVALGQIGSANPETLPVILPALGRAIRQDASPVVRQQATAAIGLQKAEDAAPAARDLAEALRSERDAGVKRELAGVLGRLGRAAKPGVGPLTATLSDPDARVRAAAADALGRIGPDAASAAPDLLKLFKDAEKPVRQAAVFAVGRVSPEDVAGAAKALVGVLTGEKDADLRREAIGSLAFVGDRSPETVRAVAGVLADPAVEFRLTAATTLAKFGPAGRLAETELKRAASADADKQVRVNAVQALSAVAGSDVSQLIPFLADRLKHDADFEVRVAVAERLGSFGSAGRPALPALRQAQSDPQLKVREAAVSAIKRIEKTAGPGKF
ncbi:MAG: HEAT repeat domain-containing protein [Gemmataceae bacterium]